MKVLLVSIILLLCVPPAFSQSHFDLNAYSQFLAQNQNLTYDALQTKFPAKFDYYKGMRPRPKLNDFLYFDSIKIKYRLTEDELELLEQNQFVVTERLRYDCFGSALHDVYIKDLPVFLSADAILHAMHASYDQVLSDIEKDFLKPNLSELLNRMYASFPDLLKKYAGNTRLQDALNGVDIYVTLAYSLINGREESAQYVNQQKIDSLWLAVQKAQPASFALFTKRRRSFDFSQFKVRGHYNTDELRDYFKAMMWLGRIDYFLTPPPENPFEPPWDAEDIRKMNLGAFMLDELLDMASARSLLNENDHIITFMVGESDNLTPTEFKAIKDSLYLTSAVQLLDDNTYNEYLHALTENNEASQKILSQLITMNPFDAEPGELPISFRLMGQRFIIDSYIFSNVVFDRIIFNNKKIWRPLPDPLDALFVLGNDDALPLLKEEIETYKYASQLNALRYLVDAYDPAFWNLSLYNVWLNSIRALNPPQNRDGFPFFMKTAAWQQCKLNTQLASWAELRHDNLLYARQSYTGITGCSFPYSYIEPYPQLYARIAAFAEKAHAYFAQFPADQFDHLPAIQKYFLDLKNTMLKLETIAQKELTDTPLDEAEMNWLRQMLFVNEESGAPPFTGWYASLFYIHDDAARGDYIIADVHTQPSDAEGNPVGHVLHVGTGKINLGIFLAHAPYPDAPPIAFAGPVFSYYEKITDNFQRLTDEEWTELVKANQLPARPDWVNIYLVDSTGKKYPTGRELPSRVYVGIDQTDAKTAQSFDLFPNYPNPFNPTTTIRYRIANRERVRLTIYDVRGKTVKELVNRIQRPGTFTVRLNAKNLSSGVYFCRLKAGHFAKTIKMTLIR